MRWEGHVAHIAEKRNVYRFVVGKLVKNKHLNGVSAYWMGVTNGCYRNIMARCEMESCY
jgi:hypothetical protein